MRVCVGVGWVCWGGGGGAGGGHFYINRNLLRNNKFDSFIFS